MQSRAAATAEARVELREAIRLQEEEKWPEALGAIRRARAALPGLWPDQDLRAELEERGKDLEMGYRLQEAHFQVVPVQAGGHGWEGVSAAYREAFAWYGLDVDKLHTEEAIRFMRSRSIRPQLAVALDELAFLRQLDNEPWKHLLAVSRQLDPDPWRNRLRDAFERKDPQALEEVIASARADELSPASAVFLGRAVERPSPAAARAAVVPIMRQVRLRHPNDFWINRQLALLLLSLGPTHYQEALRYQTAAVSLRPLSPWAHLELGTALAAINQRDEAIAECREAVRLNKDFDRAHTYLAGYLHAEGHLQEAEAEYRRAVEVSPNKVANHRDLAYFLENQGRLKEAEAEYRKVIELSPKAEYHASLADILEKQGRREEALAERRKAADLRPGNSSTHLDLARRLAALGRPEEAEAECRKAIELDSKNFGAHGVLGDCLADQGRLKEAEAEYRRAIELNDIPHEHANLADYLEKQGRLEEAAAEYCRAIELAPWFAPAYSDLGRILKKRGRLEEAETTLRKAIELAPRGYTPHYFLGAVLMDQGRLEEAEAELRKAVDQCPPTSPWRKENARLLERCQRFRGLEQKLPAVLEGKVQPASADERLELAGLCALPYQRRYALAVRLFADAFAAEPKLAVDLDAQSRYNAACYAALAGCGQGKDTDPSDDQERARLRRQALKWLRADLAAYRRLPEKDPDKAGPLVRQRLRHWQQDKDFAGVRGPDALGKLPEDERAAWRRLWEEVEALLKSAPGAP
jgi:tetratricopeptide (TPR) repeat protein